jgi:DNA-binding response OmpR family regulator
MCELLKPYKFDLDATGDADEALKKCKQNMPDVVVFSDALEGMDRATFLRRLGRSGGGRKPIVLMVCDEPDADSLGKALWEGANACMVRPFDARVLEDKLHQAGAV